MYTSLIFKTILNMPDFKNIKVVDRNNKVLGEFKIVDTETIEGLKKTLIKDCEAIRKRKIGVERVRLTIGDSRGVALADKRKTLKDYCNTNDVVLAFKDLGP
jgi:hypothetical protein